MSRKRTYGFGFRPDESRHHFHIHIPRQAAAEIVIQEVRRETEETRCVLSRQRWDLIAYHLQGSFNVRLQKAGLPTGRWHAGVIPVERLLGKELCGLAWAIEGADVERIRLAVSRWFSLWETERWWLYTETAAASGRAIEDRKKGWRELLHLWMTAEIPTRRSGMRAPLDLAFFVVHSKRGGDSVRLYELANPESPGDRQEDPDLLRAEIPRAAWLVMSAIVAPYFRRRQKVKRAAGGNEALVWHSWNDVLPRTLGRELALLGWGLEEADPAHVPAILSNWSGLRPEERWQLYQWTNEACGSLPLGRGRGFA
jgi:Protein of unknown function (DUF3780)